jgi:hypothetical protein
MSGMDDYIDNIERIKYWKDHTLKKQIVENRISICKNIKKQIQSKINKIKGQATADTLLQSVDRIFISNALISITSINDLLKNLRDSSNNRILDGGQIKKDYLDMLYPFVLYLCTGKYEAQYKDFKILTDIDLKSQQTSDLYNTLDNNRKYLSEMDKSIFYGINRLKNEQNFSKSVSDAPIPFFGAPTSNNSIYANLKTNAFNKTSKFNKFKKIDNFIEKLISSREISINNILYAWNKLDKGKGKNNLLKNTYASWTIYKLSRTKNVPYLKDFLKNNVLLLSIKNDKVYDILFSKDPDNPSNNLTMNDILNYSKGRHVKINKIDTLELLKKRRFALKKYLYDTKNSNAIVLPQVESFTQFNDSLSNNNCFENSYISFLTNNGFRKL